MGLQTTNKHDAYKTHQRKNLSDREIEARALLMCASQLDSVGKNEGDRKSYDEAIRRNQKLWTLFQVALCDPANQLPLELKTTLLNLSCYVDRVSFRALAEYNSGLLVSLIDINRRIATGLSSKRPGDEITAAALPPTEALPSPVMTTA